MLSCFFMAIGVTFIILAIVIVAIWLIIEAKRLRHKIVAIVLILLIIFTYVSFSVIIKNNHVDLKTKEGWASAGKLYFFWLGWIFKNLKSITTFAIKQDWKYMNNTTTIDHNEISDSTEKKESFWKRLTK